MDVTTREFMIGEIDDDEFNLYKFLLEMEETFVPY
jgi:hypothetical protein